MSRNTYSILLACCFASALPASPIQAADVGSVEIVNAEGRLYQKLVQDAGATVPRGFVQSITPPDGKLFLTVWLDLKVTTGKDESGDEIVRVEEKAIGIATPEGGLLPPIGRCSRDGRFYTYTGDFQYYGQPKQETLPWEMVFMVPAKGRAFELKLGAASAKLKVTEPVAPTIPRSTAAGFQVKRVEVVEQLAGQQELGSFDTRQGAAVTQVESLTGKYVVVQLIVKPKTSNMESTFQFSSFDFGLLFGTQVYAPPVGYIAYNDFTPFANTYTSERDAAGDFPAVEATIVFPLPAKVSKFKVLYLLEPAAEGSISN